MWALSGVGRKRGERERSVEPEVVDRQRNGERVSLTKIGLSAEPQIGRSRSAHMICAAVEHNNAQTKRDKTKM